MNDPWYIYVPGFTAQLLFSLRTLVQWLTSEHEKSVQSPSAYWTCSLAASCIFCFYGWLRHDFSIILGQFITYYIYIWNLNIKGVWKRIPGVIRTFLLLVPAIAALCMAGDAQGFVRNFLNNPEIPAWMVLFGSAGQILFTLRFVYQWGWSLRHKVSQLPAPFWIISLAGSALIIAYGIMRRDPVLIIGQSFGFIIYMRNLMIGHQSQTTL